jgi:hypothetical protein
MWSVVANSAIQCPGSLPNHGWVCPNRKTVTTTLKMPLEVKKLWDQCADAEQRTLTNMFEMMVFHYANKLGIDSSVRSVVTETLPKSIKKK